MTTPQCQFSNLTFWKEGGTRSYSMAGVTQDDELEFHIRLVPNGRVTSKLDEHIKIGDSIKLNGPLGASYLRRQNTDPILCIATGTGLAPIISIIRGALESGMKNDIHLILGARTEEDLYGLDYLDRLASEHTNFRFLIALNHTKPNSAHVRGLVTDVIHEHFPALENWRIYLAGSPAIVEAASLLARNVVRISSVFTPMPFTRVAYKNESQSTAATSHNIKKVHVFTRNSQFR
ncbi:FAD-binding oxidoreductase [Vibrio sp. PP-XX7]